MWDELTAAIMVQDSIATKSGEETHKLFVCLFNCFCVSFVKINYLWRSTIHGDQATEAHWFTTQVVLITVVDFLVQNS